MKRSGAQIDRLILRAVCEDIVPFEAIESSLRQDLETDELEQLATRLLRLIKSGLVDSYLLHIEAPHLTPIDTDVESVYRHWFFISEEGLCHLNQPRMVNGSWRASPAIDRRWRLRCDQRNGKSAGC